MEKEKTQLLIEFSLFLNAALNLSLDESVGTDEQEQNDDHP